MSQNDPWTHLKVRKRTLERLKAVAARLVALHEAGTVEVPQVNPEPKSPTACGLSMDSLINILLDERDDHNRRAKESRARKRRARDQERDQADQADQGSGQGG